MVDNMMRIAGRNANGVAKAVSTDDAGKVRVVADALHTYAWVAGTISSTSLKGNYSDWIFAKGENEDSLESGTIMVTTTNTPPFLGPEGFTDATPTWIGIPVAAGGYRTFHATIWSDANANFDVSAYLLPEISGDFNGVNISFGLLAQTLFTSEILSSSSPIDFGIGGLDKTNYNPWPSGYLVIKIVAATTPTSGAVRVGVERQK